MFFYLCLQPKNIFFLVWDSHRHFSLSAKASILYDPWMPFGQVLQTNESKKSVKTENNAGHERDRDRE